ncbi:MAG: 30S ribosomal protein S2 [Nanoarchaeota archaeon]|nr:30S ribosomal protein S2 [Nanoarchaeota archaeon]
MAKKKEDKENEQAEEVVVNSEKEEKKKRSKKEDGKVENSDDDSKEDRKAKLAKLLEKAEKLKSKVEDVKDVDLKKKVRPEDKEDKKETLVPMEDYLKSSIHLGTRVITPDMRKYVYRRRADGLAVFNTALLDDLIREGAEYLSKFDPKDVIIVCKREAGWKAVKKFAEIIGMRAFTKKYPAGILTNTQLENFIEAEMIFICDPWLDKNALQDSNRIKIPVLSICDTNNFTQGITKIIPGNNKSAKSLGMILYLLAKIYIQNRKLDVEEPKIQDFVDDWDNLVPPK